MRIEKITTPPSFDGSEGLIATIVRGDVPPDGVNFVTESGDALQVGMMRHKKGWNSAPHQHILSPREVRGGGEVLVIMYGSVDVEFYDSAGNWVAKSTLESGDVLIQHSGGHSFLAKTSFNAIEVKQGPYRPEEKVYLHASIDSM